MKEHDLSSEKWREYLIPGRSAPYRITNPVSLFLRDGGTTHRVLDREGVVHCIPFGGTSGVVLRWLATPPVTF